MNVLVVGGAGYIGGCLTDILLDAGHHVSVFDRLLYEDRFLKEVPFVYGDVRDTDLLVSIHDRYDAIAWLAALVGDGACAHDRDLTFEVNYRALKRFVDRTGRRVLFPSTCSVYGAQDGLLTEDSPVQPLSAYAESKLAAEQIVLDHGGLVFRLGTLFGLGDRHSRLRLDLVINALTYKALHERRITIFGGEQWRPVLAVRDAAQYFAEAISRDYTAVYNLGKRNIRIRDCAPIFQAIFPDVEVELVDTKYEDARNYRVSTARAAHDFLHTPSITVEAEIDRMVQLLREQRIKDPLDRHYYNTHHVGASLDSLRSVPRHASTDDARASDRREGVSDHRGAPEPLPVQ